MKCVVALAILVAAAGCDRETEGPSEDLQADARRLANRMGEDLELESLEEVEALVDEDLPVRAAQLLEGGTLPAARRHVRHVSEETMSSATGRQLREEAVGVLQARVDALVTYQEALERGLMEDLVLLDSLRQQREAEVAVTAFIERLEEMQAGRR